MVSGLLLLSSSPDLADSTNGPVSSTGLRITSRRRSEAWDDCSSTYLCSCGVEVSCVMGAISNDRLDLHMHLNHQDDPGSGVIVVRFGQGLGDDRPGFVDPEVELPPALDALSTVFGRSPLLFTEDGKSAAIDDQSE